MKQSRKWGILLAGLCAGAVNGIFGAGGGMVLVPLLHLLSPMDDQEVFSSSIAIILPICLVALSVTAMTGGIAFQTALPYLWGSAAGGIAAGLWGHKIPSIWLHRLLGLFIIWGGIRYLC